jgi:hypothetical protein
LAASAAGGRLARAHRVQLNGNVPVPSAADALLGLLLPFWQLVLGGVMVVFLVGATAKLARRGRSRMNTAIVISGAAVLGLVLIGLIAAQ